MFDMLHQSNIEQLEDKLKRALERNEFRLVYQPKVNLVTGKIKGVEALIRWEHPENGVLMPTEFIPFAEQTGLIKQIDEWVLYHACLQNKKWEKIVSFPIKLSVNISAQHLYQTNFIERVRYILKETDFVPESLILEINGNFIIDDIKVYRVLKEIKNIGIQICLDNFGTGNSSLQMLREASFDQIKIDRSFIQRCPTDLADKIIVKSIIEIAQQLEIELIAEGIESKEQLEFLQENACELGQGYLFSKPIPQSELFHQINKIEKTFIQVKKFNETLNQVTFKMDCKELQDTLRLYQGMIFKYKKKKDRFIFTLCDGELMNRLGYSSNQIVGRELFDFLPKITADEKSELFHKAWVGKESITYRSQAKGITYLVSLRPIHKEGEVAEVLGFCYDITEQIKIEAQYQIIAENMHDMVGTFDKNFKMIYVSPSCEKVLGFSIKDYKRFFSVELIHPEDVSTLRKKLSLFVTTKQPSQIEFRHKHANGGWVYIESQLTPVLGETGDLISFIAVGRNITERKNTEKLIRNAEKLAVIGQLASSIAHEIRNPLTTIMGFAQLLNTEVNDPMYIETMLSEIKSIEKKVEEFIAFANLQTQEFEETCLSNVLKDVVLLFKEQCALKNIKIVQEFEMKIPLIYCDKNQIKQVFIHILQNSCDSMSTGGNIIVRVSRICEKSIKISFIDQGCGISQERLKHIGEPFYNLKEKGTGMGLMICNKIIQEHGGTLDIKSILNQGTTVDVFLPIKYD